MIDDLDKHLARLRVEKGPAWADSFESEYDYFRACYIATQARGMLGISREEVAAKSGVSTRVIGQIEKTKPGIPGDAITAVTKFLLSIFAQQQRRNVRGDVNRLGAMVAQRRAEMDFMPTP